MYQVEMVCLNQVVAQDHRYRSFIKVWDFKTINQMLSVVRNKNPYEGYGIERLFRCLLLQFLEDLSDRELELVLDWAELYQEELLEDWELCQLKQLPKKIEPLH